MPGDDPIMREILAAVAALQRGDRAGGKQALEAVWSHIAQSPEPFHECVLSHYMADAQDNIADELAWDVRALEAGRRSSETDAPAPGTPLSIASFMPSLHLSLCDDYFRLGDFARSGEHLEAARSCIGVLADDGYGKMIRSGFVRLEKKLAARGG